jgi:D-3-phosphoglycerate dehydrogenase / 2-oxoglutarate reductase
LNVLIADHLSPEAKDGFEALGLRVTESPDLTVDTLPQAVLGHEILIVRDTRVTRRAIEAGDDLLLIVRAGVGVDTIDVDAASEQAVFVADCPDYDARARAEFALGLLIELDRHAERRGEPGDGPPALGLWGRSLGLYGYSATAAHLTAVTSAMGMSVKVYTDSLTGALAAEAGVHDCDAPEELFERCDFISLHADIDGALPVVSADLLATLSDGQVLVAVEGCEPLDLAAVETAVTQKKLRLGIDAPTTSLNGDDEAILQRLSKKNTVRISRGEAPDTAEAWGELAHEAVLIVHDFLLHGRVAHSANVAIGGPAAATLIVRHHHKTDALVSVFGELKEEGIQVLDIDNVIFEPSHSACLHLRLERVPCPDTLTRIRRHETIRRVDLVEH